MLQENPKIFFRERKQMKINTAKDLGVLWSRDRHLCS